MAFSYLQADGVVSRRWASPGCRPAHDFIGLMSLPLMRRFPRSGTEVDNRSAGRVNVPNLVAVRPGWSPDWPRDSAERPVPHAFWAFQEFWRVDQVFEVPLKSLPLDSSQHSLGLTALRQAAGGDTALVLQHNHWLSAGCSAGNANTSTSDIDRVLHVRVK